MAKVILTGIIAEITGSIGGTTFQNTRSGLIARRKPIPTKTRTSKQSAILAKHSTLNAQFILLPLSTKIQWDSFALAHTRENKYGSNNILTGINWYQSINFSLFLISEPLVVFPPSYIPPFAPLSYTGCLENNELKITNAYPADASDHSILIYTTPPLTRSTISDWSNFRLTKIININPSSIIDLTSDWEITHSRTLNTSQLSSGTIIGIAIQSARKSTGLKSNFVYLLQNVNTCNLMKSYIALMTQAGVAAPTPVILSNSIGNIVWTRLVTGRYYGTLVGSFPVDTVFTLIGGNTGGNIFILERDSDDAIFLQSLTPGYISSDDLLNGTGIICQVFN